MSTTTIQRQRGGSKPALHPATCLWLRNLYLADKSQNLSDLHRRIIQQWQHWRETKDPKYAIPGYKHCPRDAGSGTPRGLTYPSFYRLIHQRPRPPKVAPTPIPTLQHQDNLAAAQENLAYWTWKKANATTPHAIADAGARVLLWQMQVDHLTA